MRKLRLHLPLGRLFGPGEIFAGAGSIGVLAGVGASRIAVLVSSSVAASDASMRSVAAAVRRTQSMTVVMPKGEPTLESIRAPLRAVTEFRPDWIVAIGGGSTIDGAKLVRALYEHPTLSPEVMARPHSLPPLDKSRFAAVPTTTGSGAEASAVAVYQRQTGEGKTLLISYDLLPDLAILDPLLLRGLPAEVLFASAGDALAHAVEAYASRQATPLTDALAETAVRRIARALPKMAGDRTDADVVDLLTAACFAGVIQNFAAPGLGHAIAHQLAAHGVPHSVATSALLPRAVAANMAADSAVGAKYAQLADVLNLADGKSLVSALTGLVASTQAEFDRQTRAVDPTAAAFCDAVKADPCARVNPVPVTPELIASAFSPVVA